MRDLLFSKSARHRVEELAETQLKCLADCSNHLVGETVNGCALEHVAGSAIHVVLGHIGDEILNILQQRIMK